jgi:hypothetical protein
MRLGRWSLSVVALAGVMATAVAVATIWLILTDPVKVADLTNDASHGNVAPLVQALGSVLFDALKGLFKYL